MPSKGTIITIVILMTISHLSCILSMDKSRFRSVVVEVTGKKFIRYSKKNMSDKFFSQENVNPIPIDVHNILVWLKRSVKSFHIKRNLITMADYNEKDYFVTYRGRLIEGKEEILK